MKYIFTFIMLVSMSVASFAQAPKVEDRVAALESQVKNMQNELSSVQVRLNELADRNAEYKKALDIKQTLNATDADGYQYGFKSAIGDVKTGKLVIYLSVFNPGVTRTKQMEEAYFSDYDDHAFRSYDFNFGSIGSQRAPIDGNTSIELQIYFENIPTNTKRINSLTVNGYSSAGGITDTSINLRDLPIQWK